MFAGGNLNAGSNNIYLGSNVTGVAAESNTIYLGNQGGHTKTVIAGIRGTTVTGGEMVLVDAAGRLGSGPVAPATNTVGSAEVIDDSLTASDLGPNSVTASELAADSVTADKVAFNYAASAGEGGPASDVACLGCIAATEVSFSFAGLGANTFSATQTINTGNLDLDPSTGAAGNITKNGTLFLHNFGNTNTFLGIQAGNLGMTGFQNTAAGTQALQSITSGSDNTAVGAFALKSNTTGVHNTAHGGFSLQFNTTGNQNTAIGAGALGDSSNTTGGNNTATGAFALRANSGHGNTTIGSRSLENITTGNDNVAVGFFAGLGSTTGSNNIYLGANVNGVAGESNAMYLGRQGTQTKTVIAGVRGTAVTGGEIVLIDAAGRLGSGPVAPGTNSVGSAEVIDDSLTASDLAPNSVTASELASDSVTADKVAFSYAAGTSEGGAALDVACLGCVAATEVGFNFAGLGANTFSATQTINTGNLDLDPSTPTTGTITKEGLPFLHNFGPNNTFLGVNAGNFAVFGAFNSTAVGRNAGTNFVGGDNVAVGFNAGLNATNGSNNIYLGANVFGVPSESNTIYLGAQGTQTKTVIAGIRGITTGNADAIQVYIDSAGQLGTASSSKRFKDDIRDMADASRRLFQLRPVTFRYSQAFNDGSKPIQYGLVAEEVAEVFPELAVRNAAGVVETVHYQKLNVLLLNELQRQEEEIRSQQRRIEALERQMNDLLAQQRIKP
jgi:hypothetical protein